MKDKTVKRQIPVLVDGKVKNVEATFFPERKSVDYMPYLKEFLKLDLDVDLDACPHALYIDVAAWWADTGNYICPGEFLDYRVQLMYWASFLIDRNLI